MGAALIRCSSADLGDRHNNSRGRGPGGRRRVQPLHGEQDPGSPHCPDCGRSHRLHCRFPGMLRGRQGEAVDFSQRKQLIACFGVFLLRIDNI